MRRIPLDAREHFESKSALIWVIKLFLKRIWCLSFATKGFESAKLGGGCTRFPLHTHNTGLTTRRKKNKTHFRGDDWKSRKNIRNQKTARNKTQNLSKNKQLLQLCCFILPFFFAVDTHWHEEKKKGNAVTGWKAATIQGEKERAREREREYKACQQCMWEYYLDLKTFSSSRSCAEISVLTQMCRKGEALATK